MEERKPAIEASSTAGSRRPGGTAALLIDVAAMLSSLSDQTLMANPPLCALLVEYSCWELELATWHDRQPARNDAGFKTWISEGREMFDRLDHLKRVADRLRPSF